jgi:hypothetical protein
MSFAFIQGTLFFKVFDQQQEVRKYLLRYFLKLTPNSNNLKIVKGDVKCILWQKIEGKYSRETVS